MRLLHTSDTHLGHQQYARLDPDTGLNQKEMDHQHAWMAVVDHAVQTKPDLFVHAGDLFDGVRPSNRALAAALDGLCKLSDAGIETVIIAGNHEHPKLRATGSPFRLFEHLEHIHPVYKGQAETLDIAGCKVHAVPQCQDQDVLRAEVGRHKPGPDDVLVMHGSVMDLPAFYHAEFNEQSLNRRWFDGYAYVALGHYHGMTEVAKNAWYCGASERVSMAEAAESKGFLEATTGSDLQVTFQELQTRPYKDLGTFDAQGRTAGDIAEHVRSNLGRAPAHAVARQTVINVAPDLRGSLDVSRLKQEAAHLLHFDLRLQWDDETKSTGGGVNIGGLEQEFSTFVGSLSLDGLDREQLTALALKTLAENA